MGTRTLPRGAGGLPLAPQRTPSTAPGRHPRRRRSRGAGCGTGQRPGPLGGFARRPTAPDRRRVGHQHRTDLDHRRTPRLICYRDSQRPPVIPSRASTIYSRAPGTGQGPVAHHDPWSPACQSRSHLSVWPRLSAWLCISTGPGIVHSLGGHRGATGTRRCAASPIDRGRSNGG